MTTQDILNLRLQNQHLTNPKFQTPKQVVEWLGAVQAQEFLPSLYSIGLRMEKSTQELVEQSVNNKEIVRTWPMRGTLHFVTPENIRWMLKYLTPQVGRKMQSYYRKIDLTEKHFAKVTEILNEILSGGKALSRPEIYKELNSRKIKTDGMRGLMTMGQMAMNQVICIGPRQGKQQTFVLLNEWVPKSLELTKEEALGKLALTFFKSHGPATVHDLARWAGITITETKLGIELNKDKLEEIKVNDESYFTAPNKFKLENDSGAFLLPTYDEYTVAYKNAGKLLLDDSKGGSLYYEKGFWSSMVWNGKIVGTWRREESKGVMNITCKIMYQLSSRQKDAFSKVAANYGKFINLPVEISYD